MNSKLFSFMLCAAMASAAAPAGAQTDEIGALDTKDVSGLIDVLLQDPADLTDEQKANARAILLEELALSSPGDIAKRRSIGEALRAMDPSDRVAVSLLEGNTKVPEPAAQVLPDRFKEALATRDGAALIGLVLADGFSIGELAGQSDKVEEVVATYVRPLPASDAEGNKQGYQALAILDPSNEKYAEKAAQYAAAEVAKRNALLRTLKKKTDDFNGITFYTHPTEPRYADTRTYFLPYLAEKDGRVWMRFQAHYTNDSWLFVESLSFNIDGQIHRFPNADWKRDNDSEIWEWADITVDKSLEELLLEIANSKTTIARFDGRQYYDNVTVRASDKQAIKDMFAAKRLLETSASQ
jgi:hypothetical protein